MAIETDKNTNYGGTAVTQKYSPLHNITYKSGDSAVYSALLTNRANLLASTHILPQALYLCTDWTTILANVSGASPLVVISNNRSNWIAAGVEAAKKQRAKIEYSGSNDLKALTALDRQTQSPPLYVPQRTEGDRKIFIVVHIFEYAQYRDALAGSGMTVVGWAFKTPETRKPLAGFGASRYAAIEFCKHLRAKKAGAKFDYAWLLDDNVVGLTGFPGYGPAEAAIAAGTTQRICLGFQGGSGVESQLEIKSWAETWSRHAKPTELPAPTKPSIVQQVALWNIKYLTDKNLNFSPLFVTSGEDVSFGNYIDINETPYLYYGSIRVRKEVVGYHDYDPKAEGPVPDHATGAKKVAAAADFYAKRFAEEEEKPAVPPRTLPPPVQVEPKEPADGGVQTLGNFITTWFSGASKPTLVNAAAASVRIKAKCQAVEQIVCGAIKGKYVNEDTLYSTFKLHGEASQYVRRFPPPPVRR